MKRYLAAALLALTFGAGVCAAELKIAVIDMQKAFEFGKGQVGGIRGALAPEVVEDGADAPPGFDGMAHEVVDVEEVGIDLLPQAARAAEGRDAAFDGDAGSGEDEEVLFLREDVGGGEDGIVVHGKNSGKSEKKPI